MCRSYFYFSDGKLCFEKNAKVVKYIVSFKSRENNIILGDSRLTIVNIKLLDLIFSKMEGQFFSKTRKPRNISENMVVGLDSSPMSLHHEELWSTQCVNFGSFER